MDDLANQVEQALKGKLTTEELGNLADYLQKYPYFPLGHVVRAKAQANDTHVFRAALYTSNRWQLKKFLEGTYYGAVSSATEPIPMPPIPDSAPLAIQSSPTGPAYCQEIFSILGEVPLELNHIGKKLFSRIKTLSAVPKGQVVLDQVIAHRVHSSRRLRLRMQKELKTYLTRQAKADMRARRQAQASSLVARFLDAKPSMPRQGKLTPEQVATATTPARPSSLSEPPATETLAQLFLRQNRPGEARKIFEKLRLRFPEKRAYFDAQIQKLSL